MSRSVRGHDVITTKITWDREISRIVYTRCAGCHNAGGAAFSLATYAEARPWAAAIKEEVEERRMPPWGAVKGFGDFRNDEALTPEQIELIVSWVSGGAPEGDAKDLPPAPKPSKAASRAASKRRNHSHRRHQVARRLGSRWSLAAVHFRRRFVSSDGGTARWRDRAFAVDLPIQASIPAFVSASRAAQAAARHYDSWRSRWIGPALVRAYSRRVTGTSKRAVLTTPLRWNCTQMR